MDTKHCSKCDRSLPVAEFHVHRAAKDGRQRHCRDCRKTWANAANRRRYEATLAAGSFTCRKCGQLRDAAEVVPFHGNLCRLCNRWKNVKFTYDVLDADGVVRRMTPADWEAMFEAQGRSCAICRGTDPEAHGQWATDHDHATNLVRGILCNPCNVMLGFARDSAERLEAGATYLRNHGGLIG